MELKDKYYYFTSALSKKYCQNIIKHSLSKEDTVAVIGGKDKKEYSKEQIKFMKKDIRDSSITWLNDPWIYRRIKPYLRLANKETGWNFSYDWIESLQFTKYKKNQYYSWHVDSFPEPFKRSHKGKIRKLSFICQLSDPNTHEGGELEFAIPNVVKGKLDFATFTLKEVLPMGSIVVFPSFIWHRVKPVTKGVRYSLVSWAIGDPYC